MRIDAIEWRKYVGALLEVLLVDRRESSEEKAARQGVTLHQYAALSVLQYLLDHHADDLEVIHHDVN